ncbi:MAG TPA: AraC family transcriptional regulator [Polyangia bacterium]
MKPETRSFYQVAVQRALEHVVGGLDRALDLEQLARTAALSPFHFHRIFRGMVGETPLELHRRLRMERAARALLESDEGVTAIALGAGYDSHEAFTRAFRSLYACAPSEFRQRGRVALDGCTRPPQVELAAASGIHHRTVSRADSEPGFALRFVIPPFAKEETAMNAEIKFMPPMRVATVRHVGPYNRISEAFARLHQSAAPAGLVRNKPTMLAIYHDDPETTPEAELRSDAAIVISNDAALPAGLGEQRISGGRYATFVHIGPYEKLGDAWAWLMGQWLPRSGQRVGSGVSYEIYRNTPMDVPKDKLETEIYVPLADPQA